MRYMPLSAWFALCAQVAQTTPELRGSQHAMHCTSGHPRPSQGWPHTLRLNLHAVGGSSGRQLERRRRWWVLPLLGGARGADGLGRREVSDARHSDLRRGAAQTDSVHFQIMYTFIDADMSSGES